MSEMYDAPLVKRLKVMSVALVAVFAISVSAVSAAQADSWKADKTPAAVSGTTTGDVFILFGSTVKCTQNTFIGELLTSSEALAVTPTYTNCKLGLFPMTWSSGAAKLQLSTAKLAGGNRAVSIVGGSIHIDVFASNAAKEAGTPMCEMTIPAQGPLGGTIAYANSGNRVVVSGAVTGLKVTQVRKAAYCPSGTETNSAEYLLQNGGLSLGAYAGGAATRLYVG